MNIELNDDQNKAMDDILHWFDCNRNDKLIFTLSGYAGTGKTFLVNYIINEILKLPSNRVAFVSPTGKAASVLIQRGAKNASTIHKLIYNRVDIEYETEINGKKIKSKRTEFVKKPSIPNYKLIVLDEVSMVEEKILEDLMSFGIPILACGDSGQLPSLFKSNTLLNSPDAQLNKIMRQAEGDSIIKIATMARQGQKIPVGNYGNVIVTHKNLLTEENMKNILLKSDQILAGTNKTCISINNKVKEYLNLKLNQININEKIICLLNNWDTYLDSGCQYSLVNGIIGTVKKNEIINSKELLSKLTFQADFLNEECDDLIYDDSIFSKGEFVHQFGDQIYIMSDGSVELKKFAPIKKETQDDENYKELLKEFVAQKRDASITEQLNFFQTAYCITTHKSQGSEWENVVVFDESRFFPQPEKWLYTAITRAKKKLVLLI